MKSIHFTLQGKGGVGKSLVSSLVAQFLRGKDRPVVCVDTDPVNATFFGYKALEVRRVELMDGSTLDERKFDELMEWAVSEDADFVVDNGAASFIPLTNYMIENDAFTLLAEQDCQVFVHCIITGGQALVETLTGFDALATQLPATARLVVWLNEFFGPIEMESGGEMKRFEDMKVYAKHKERVHALVRIPKQTQSTFGRDVQLMLDKKLTFNQVQTAPEFGLMAKQRLSTIWTHLQNQIRVAV